MTICIRSMCTHTHSADTPPNTQQLLDSTSTTTDDDETIPTELIILAETSFILCVTLPRCLPRYPTRMCGH